MSATVYNELSDEKLIERLQFNDHQAFEILYSRYWEQLYVSALKVVNDNEKAQDVVQDIFIDIWAKRHHLNVDKVSSFLFSAVKYKSLMQLRSAKLSATYLELLDRVVDENTVDNQMAFNELNETLESSIAELPERCRQVFTMSRYEHLSHPEIAKKLDVSVRTVEAHIHNALKHIRVSIERMSLVLLIISFFTKLF